VAEKGQGKRAALERAVVLRLRQGDIDRDEKNIIALGYGGLFAAVSLSGCYSTGHTTSYFTN
jgi:hypothetical protein